MKRYRKTVHSNSGLRIELVGYRHGVGWRVTATCAEREVAYTAYADKIDAAADMAVYQLELLCGYISI